ncbi:MAG: hypothetical protein FWH18_01970 [Marinilabiliaceae bacterium]|nr:hypothetical protein [Marinilabiliaceae bacterium]
MIRKNKKFLIVLVITIALFWGLLMLSDYFELARALCVIILFPFAPLWMAFEHYCRSFNDPHFSLPINDEITQMILFLFSCVGQSLIYCWLYKKIYSFFKDNKNN